MADYYRNMPLEQRISSLREGDVTRYGTPIRSRRLTVQPRKKTDMHYYWQEGSATGVDPDAPKVWAPMYSHASQDIVTRLRIIHCAADDLTPCGTCLICQAADEIERLRNYPKTGIVQTSDAEGDIERLDREIMRRDGTILKLRAAGDALLDRLNDWHNGAPYDLDTEAIKAWEEARRD